MTDEDMMTILERALLIPVKESDAACILLQVRERLREEAAEQQRAVDCAPHSPNCALVVSLIADCNCGAYEAHSH